MTSWAWRELRKNVLADWFLLRSNFRYVLKRRDREQELMSANAINVIDLLAVQDSILEVISFLLMFDRPLLYLIFNIKAPVVHSISLC